MVSQRPSSSRAVLDDAARAVDVLAKSILHDSYAHFELVRLELTETELDRVQVRLAVRRTQPDATHVEQLIEGTGVGLVDAVFEAFTRVYVSEHPSLRTISLADFQLKPGFESAKGRKSDATATAVLVVHNSEGVSYRFEQTSKSITWSSVTVVVDALAFFINAERAYVQLQVAHKDAKDRRRSDLVERYAQQMGVLVAATSFTSLADKFSRT
jgi:hypothetical protein